MDDYEKQVADAKAEAGRVEAQRKLVITSLAKHPDGRAFLWWLLDQGNVFASTFIAGAPDASAFSEGKRSYGLLILHEIIRADPALFPQLMKENSRGRRTSSDADGASKDGTGEG